MKTNSDLTKKNYSFQIRYLLLFLFLTVLCAFSAVSAQFFKGSVLDHALEGNTKKAILYGLLLASIVIFDIITNYLSDYTRGHFLVEITRKLRSDYFGALLRKPLSVVINETQGEYIGKYTNQIDLISNDFYGTIPLLIDVMVRILFVSLSLFILDLRIAIITIVLLTTPLYIPKLLEKKLQSTQSRKVAVFQKHISSVVDWISGLELIKNSSIESIIHRKMNASLDTVKKSNLEMRIMIYKNKSLSAALSYLSHLIILIYAAFLVLKKEFTPGNFIIAIGMIDQLSYPIISISVYLQQLISARPLSKQLAQEIDGRELDDDSKIDIKKLNHIELIDVCFSYDDPGNLIDKATLELFQGEKCLIKGQSGSGKTTLINLLLNYRVPSAGKILINSLPLEKIRNLGELVGISRQDTVLFNDTLRNNISMYSDITDGEIIRILEDLNLIQYANINSLESMVEEGGRNLSGGEKRRICLARAFMRRAPLLILDEPLANLDNENASIVEDYILNYRGSIVIVISHQFSIDKEKEFDRIVSL